MLVEFEGQAMVHPMQLRKLVQVRQEGDTAKLVFYRAGKKQTVTATLAKTAAGFSSFDGTITGRPFFSTGDAFISTQIKDAQNLARHQELQALGQQNQQKIQDEIRRSLDDSRRSFDQSRRAYEQALRSGTNTSTEVESLRKALEELARAKVFLDNKSTVTVRSTGNATKSIVKTDDSGTIVVLSKPKLHLTAHDKDGKLVFDGEIETKDQRAQVPPELWKRVEPLLDKLISNPEPSPEPKPGSV